ncbi:methionyl-tRNA formyltransferase [Candidatus Roizmanbacteria bacterium]|nr:MAG: methionyl-tRNA formyltransferase [Candidatus Roizmanbacteria bacterium]
MNIAYFGSPQLSELLLDRLLEKNLPISLVITQPDKPAGKRLEITATAVKNNAVVHNIEFFDKPLKKYEDELLSIIREKKITLGILFAYGEILSTSLLKSIPFGIWNVHPSLLPKYRGPSPIVYPLILGEAETGTTLMQMNQGLDQGDILMQTSVSIKARDKREQIEQKLVALAEQQIFYALSLLKTNSLQSKQQEEHLATYTRLLKKKDGFITQTFISQALNNKNVTFEQLPEILQRYHVKNNIPPKKNYDAGPVLYHLYQGLHPWPGVWTTIKVGPNEKRLKLLDMTFEDNTPQLRQVQLEGKRAVEFSVFNKAYNCF